MNKSVPKKYMLILQRRYYKEQEAVEFTDNADAYMVPIRSFSDEKKVSSRSNNKVEKNTLAFYDAITNKFQSLNHFLSVVGKGANIDINNYKQETSYIGYLNNGRMSILNISFGDKDLAHIALVANGNSINTNDKLTMDVVTDIMDMIEDRDSDFVSVLDSFYKNQEKNKRNRFDLPTKLINDIEAYRRNKINNDISNSYRTRINDSATEDVEELRKEVIKDLKSYKNFRELYRFRKYYKEEYKNKEDKNSKGNNYNDTDDSYRKTFEEIRQKTYPKQKKKSDEIPGQMTIFDLGIKK